MSNIQQQTKALSAHNINITSLKREHTNDIKAI